MNKLLFNKNITGIKNKKVNYKKYHILFTYTFTIYFLFFVVLLSRLWLSNDDNNWRLYGMLYVCVHHWPQCMCLSIVCERIKKIGKINRNIKYINKKEIFISILNWWCCSDGLNASQHWKLTEICVDTVF